MLSRLFRLLPYALIALVSVSQVVRGIPGDSWCGRVMCVHAFVNGSEWTYQMEANLGEERLGWMAVGFGTSMSTSDMIIMWPNFDGTLTLSHRAARGRSEPFVVENPPRIARTFLPLSFQTDSRTALSFTIDPNDELQQRLIWAIATTRPGNAAIDAGLRQHVASGGITLDLTKEYEGPATLPIGPTASTGSGTFQPPSATGTDSGSNELPEFELPPLLPYQRMLMAHAVLCSVGFLIVLPIGAFVGRLGRVYTTNWFKIHWRVQLLLAGPIITAGWAVGVIGVQTKQGIHFNDTHKVAGLVLFGAYILQVLLGVHIHLFKPKSSQRSIPASAVSGGNRIQSFFQLLLTSTRPLQNYGHAIVGLTIIAVAFWNVYTGLFVEWDMATGRGSAPIEAKRFWQAWAVLVPLTYFGGLALLPRQLTQERKISQGNVRASSDALPLKPSPPSSKRNVRQMQISKPMPVKEEEEEKWRRQQERYDSEPGYAVSDDTHGHSMQPVRMATAF